MRRWLVCVLVVGACAPSAFEIRRAHGAAYATDFDTLWKAIDAELLFEYPGQTQLRTPMVNEFRDRGRFVTEWKKVDVDRYDADADAAFYHRGPTNITAIYVRELVQILPGGPPWHFAVDVEAARYVPDLSSMIPYKHGAEDEPPWVQGRIDLTYTAIFDRLRRFAVLAPPPQR